MTHEVFQISSDTDVIACYFVAWPFVDWMSQVWVEAVTGKTIIRYRFRYHAGLVAGPNDDKEVTSIEVEVPRMRAIHAARHLYEEVIGTSPYGVPQVAEGIEFERTSWLQYNPDGKGGRMVTSAETLMRWLTSRPWSTMFDSPNLS